MRSFCKAVFQVIHQNRGSVFHQISKHLEKEKNCQILVKNLNFVAGRKGLKK